MLELAHVQRLRSIARRASATRWLSGAESSALPWPALEPSGDEHRLDRVRKGEQAQGVRDGRTALAEAARDVFLGEVVLFDELREAGGFFDRVEILALQVLDDGDFERVAVVALADDRRNGRALQRGAGAPATLARDEFVSRIAPADDDRHQHAILGDRGLEFVEGGFVEGLARLEWVGGDRGDRNFAQLVLGRRDGDGRVAQQRAEAAPETAFGLAHAWTPIGSSSSRATAM